MSAEPALDLVLFRAAGWLLAVPARQVLASEMGRAEDATPLAAQVLGLEEKLPDTTPNKRFKLHFSRQSLWVDGPVELVRSPGADMHPLPDVIKARHRLPGLRALLFYQEQYALLVDMDLAKDG